MATNEALTAACHCGDISIVVPRKPEYINECQCTICYAYGAAWGYYPISEVRFTAREGSRTRQYVRSDGIKDCAFNYCAHCGCVTHWSPNTDSPPPSAKVGVNTRMIKPEQVAQVERRITYDELLKPLEPSNA